ncbi:MAG: response regulator, partial [Campylobacterota bacterium]|nr:response regulator [Campylobacterota bacterium]
FKDKKILVVDDNAIWLEILQSVLTDFGVSVDRAKSGAMAIKMIEDAKQKYDLVLMDWNMPELDGIETTKIINEKFDSDKIPRKVIMVSAFKQESIMTQAKSVGIDIYLQKPINPSILNDILSDVFLGTVNISKIKNEESGMQKSMQTLENSKILLVEDNSVNQEIIIGLLANSAIEIDIANNGKEAVELFEKNRDKYELILMDLQMPIMDGYEATTLIREINKEIPIIALTANAMKEDVERTQKIGMNEHLNKPIEVEVFYATLLKYISKKRELHVEESNSLHVEEIEVLEFDNIDSKIGLYHLAGNRKLYLKILKDFKENYSNLELEKLNAEEFKRATHTIKGLSANIGAMELNKVAKELDETQSKELLPELYKKLKVVIDELNEKLDDGNDKELKQKLSSELRQELFLELKDTVKTKLIKKCTPVIEKIEKYELEAEDQKIFDELKSVLKKYKFKDAILLCEEM